MDNESRETPTDAGLVIGNGTITGTDIGLEVSYDETATGIEEDPGVTVERTSFYLEDRLVFTAYDTDGDGRDDLWFNYDAELRLTLELRDTDGDGEPDRAVHFDRMENVIEEETLG